MRIWQADFYKRPLKNDAGQKLWELLVCEATGSFRYSAMCPQAEANASWLAEHLKQANGGNLPDLIQVFRPQSLSLLETAGKLLGVPVEANRQCNRVKDWLLLKAKDYPEEKNYTGEAVDLLAIDRPPPVPLPENLLGEQWRFAALNAGDLIDAFAGRAIPILEMPESFLPINLGLASTVPVPGVIIDGGRQSMKLARWLQDARPVAMNYIAGDPDGLILEAGLADRWVLATFEDEEVAAAAKAYEQRKQLTQGLHFLLVQPDESGMTYSGFWLLRNC